VHKALQKVAMETRVVQKAVILNKGQVLILRRSKTDVRRPLQWDLPGGLVDEGEELFASIKREIMEETGLKVDKLNPFFSKTDVREWIDDQGSHTINVVFMFYFCKTNKTEVKISHEHDKHQWVDLDKVIDEFEYPLHKEALKHLIDIQFS
jgi:8-oxo-dGTP pyrophosphatase MutT (NUDIX family)